MKFQHLILPVCLWLLIGLCVFLAVPTSPFIIGVVLVLIALATYFSLRVIVQNNLPLIVTCCFSVFLLSNVLSGFNLINLLLIAAIGTLLSQLTTSH